MHPDEGDNLCICYLLYICWICPIFYWTSWNSPALHIYHIYLGWGFILQLCKKILLAPIGAFAPGSAHARPSTQAPINTRGNLSAHVSGMGLSWLGLSIYDHKTVNKLHHFQNTDNIQGVRHRTTTISLLEDGMDFFQYFVCCFFPPVSYSFYEGLILFVFYYANGGGPMTHSLDVVGVLEMMKTVDRLVIIDA